ncbi:MAG: cytochrome C [Methylotenera sp.]|nr:cytochrome C [Methylotenera sp.]
MNIRFAFAAFTLSLCFTAPLYAADETAALALLKESKCLKCHSIDKKKDGPSYKSVAEKYKDKPEAMAKLTKHVTEPSQVEIDGVKEDHGSVKTRDAAKVKNLVEWILSLS